MFNAADFFIVSGFDLEKVNLVTSVWLARFINAINSYSEKIWVKLLFFSLLRLNSRILLQEGELF